MDVLKNLFGSLSSGIIRLLVTVGIIAAVGFFLVKPALETTEKVSSEATKSFQESFDVSDIDKSIEDANKQVQIQIQKSFKTAKKQGGGDPQKLIRCIQRAQGDVERIQRCTKRF